MNIRKTLALLEVAGCVMLASCGDVDSSEKTKRPQLGSRDVSSVIEDMAADRSESSSLSESSEDSSTLDSAPEEESSEAEAVVTDDYTKHEQIIDEHQSRLTQEPLDDEAVKVSFNWCVSAFRGDIKSMQELCTPEFAAVQQELYDEYLAPCSDISINGYNWHKGDTPLAGINLFNRQYNYNEIAWLRLEPQGDGSYLICDLWENIGREEPQSVMKTPE